MTTFEHGNAPAWACATWIYVNGPKEGVKIHSCYSDPIYAHVDRADRLCRALSLAKLAEDWGKAEKECDAVASRLEDLFIEHPESIAAGKRVDAARAALLKACAE